MERSRTLRLAHAATLVLAVLLLASGLALWSTGYADTPGVPIALLDARPSDAHALNTPLLDTGTTVLGQTFSYPSKTPAKVTSEIISMAPGAETGWHKHEVPLYGYVLDGELTVDYGSRGTRVYRKGEAFMEAIGTPHNGRNSGSGEARLLAVFMGADGLPNTVSLPPSQ
jgi:quercetin dioxygenase-like cupin family protein